MTTINYIAIYLLCGVIFASGFEHLMKRLDTPGREDTNDSQRIFWVVTWPYCIIKFFIGYYSNDKN